MALVEPTKPIATPAGASELTGLYTMFYRFNSNHLISINFRYHGSLKEARERAVEHCKVMGYRLSHVQPLIVDLKREEDFHLGAGEFSPEAVRRRNAQAREAELGAK